MLTFAAEAISRRPNLLLFEGWFFVEPLSLMRICAPAVLIPVELVGSILPCATRKQSSASEARCLSLGEF